MTNDFPSFCFASHRSSVSLGVGRSSACATLPVADNSLLLASRRLANSELTANWKALSPSIPLGKPNEALAFLRRNLEDFSGHTVRDVEKCDILPTISELLTYPNHPEFYLTSDEWSDLVTPVMLAQRQHLLNGNDKLLGNCLTAFSGPRDSGCAGLVVHPTGNNMSCINVSLLCSECCESPLSESSESNQSTSGIDSDSDSRSGIEEGIPNTGLQKWKLVTHQKWETGWEIHQINSTEVADARVIGVRTDYGCSFFKGPSCKQMTQAHEEYMAEFEDINDTHILDSDLISPFGALKSKSRLMHVSMSPHIFGDAVISTAREGLYLWSPESSLQTVRTYDPVLVGYDEKWTQCYFSAHPRQIWMATRRLVEKIDCRTSNSSLQLLSSSPDVMKNVSVLQSQLLRQFCVLFATKKHIALVDERFPSQPLLLWDHGLQRAPCFLEVQTVHEGDSSTGCYHAILLGSSNPAEAVMLTYRDGVDVQLDGGSSLSILNGGKSARLPAQSGIYFPIGKYSDWPGKMRLPLLNSAVYKRVMAPLFGMQMIGRDANDTSGFSTILQLSDRGDLFYQHLEYGIRSLDSYTQLEDCGERTCWQEHLCGDIEEWITEVEQQEKDETDRTFADETDKRGFGKYGHLYAASSNTEKDFSLPYNYAKSSTDLCYCCWMKNQTNEAKATPEAVADLRVNDGSTKSSHCRKCGFVFGQPCATFRRARMVCAPTDYKFSSSFCGNKPVASEVLDSIWKLIPTFQSHRTHRSYPHEARKINVDRFGCVESTNVTALSLVHKPDETHSAFSHKLWDDWFEGENPSLGLQSDGSAHSEVSAQRVSDDQMASSSRRVQNQSPDKSSKKKRRKVGF